MKKKAQEIIYINDFDELQSIVEELAGDGAILMSAKNLLKAAGLGFIKKFARSIIVKKDGEKCKSLHSTSKILDGLVSLNAARQSSMAVIGGGTLGDCAAFCASIYKRGMRLVLVPTTLLSMIDAAVGGKTALNYGGIKNALGSFYQADKVFVYTGFLETLSEIQIENGLFEALKCAALFSKGLFHDILNNRLLLKRYTRESASIFSVIVKKCIQYKKEICDEDPFDSGKRRCLNFGHTFGHAIEGFSKNRISHGAAVGLGIFFELLLLKKSGYFNAYCEEIIRAMAKFIKTSRQRHNLMKIMENRDFYRECLKYISHDKKAGQAQTIFIPAIIAPGRFEFAKLRLDVEVKEFLNDYESILAGWNEYAK